MTCLNCRVHALLVPLACQACGTVTAASAVVKDTVVIVGGGGQEPTANCTLFSASTQDFKQCGQAMPSARGFLGAAAVNGVVYAVGGFAAKGWNIVYVTSSAG